MAAWNGQFFHGRLMGKQGLDSSAINAVLPRRRMTLAEKREEHNAEMARRVAAIAGVMRAREGVANG